MVLVRKKKGLVSLAHLKRIFDREKNEINIYGGYIIFMSTPYNSNFQFFEIKPLVPQTLNLLDSTV